MPNIKLGCDPEAFLVDINGQLRSSIGLIGGSKEMPRPLFALGEGYAVQRTMLPLSSTFLRQKDGHHLWRVFLVH